MPHLLYSSKDDVNVELLLVLILERGVLPGRSCSGGSAVRSLLHLSSRKFVRSLSDIHVDAQPQKQSAVATSGDESCRFAQTLQQYCPSRIEVETNLETNSLAQGRKSENVRGGNRFPETWFGSNSRAGRPNSPALNGSRDDVATGGSRPIIVVVHPRAVFRDCFARCLGISYSDHEVQSFASVSEWHGSTEPGMAVPAVAIIVLQSGDVPNNGDLESLQETTAKMPVIIVADSDDVDHVVQTLRRGARGYIPSSLPFNVAVEAVRLVEAGGVFVPASSFLGRDQPPTLDKPGVTLTERQKAVLEEIRHGKANKQIAYELNMSEHTVKVHLRHIMKKLKARNRTEVAVLSETLLASKD
jgi:DNA-binding NarL/FixJ family response regulator